MKASDPSATIAGAKKLSDLDIVNKYDEIFFFFGVASNGDLDPAKHALLDQFMAARKFGRVLVTEDHADSANASRG